VANNLRRAALRINRYQKDLSSGTSIHNPSDNPAGASRSLLLRSDIRNVEQYKRNINEGLGMMNYVDSTLNDLVNILIDVRGLAIQGASDTVNAEDRDIIAEQINELIEHVISLSQSKFRGRSVFAGAETLESPYSPVRDAAGEVVSVGNSLRGSVWLTDRTTAVGTLLNQPSPPSGTVTIGDQTVAIDLATDSLDAIKTKIEAAAPTGVTVAIEEATDDGAPVYRLRISGTTTVVDSNNVLGTLNIGNVDTTKAVLREVDDGVYIQVNVAGRDLFEGAQNAFSALLTIRDALWDDDIDAIRNSITDIEAAREKVSDVRGVLGARSHRFELSQALAERYEVNLTDALSTTEDVDLTETVFNLQQEQTVFQAALMSGQTVIQPSLIEFLR
jgi:flagellar hook-associated protein 3 FlgL